MCELSLIHVFVVDLQYKELRYRRSTVEAFGDRPLVLKGETMKCTLIVRSAVGIIRLCIQTNEAYPAFSAAVP